mgnify:CR=1 FL=1
MQQVNVCGDKGVGEEKEKEKRERQRQTDRQTVRDTGT